jgi:hypothetical protein
MATFVEELIARLALDTDEQSFKKGEKGIDDLAASAVKMGAVIGAAFAAVQAAAVGLVVNYANNAKQVENLSRVAGEGFEAFQLYAAGAKMVGVEQDKLADILKDTNDKIGDFLQTGAGPMADFFEKIGPKVGITAEMFKDLSGKDALQLYVDGLERANLSQAEMTFYMEAIASDATLLLPLLKNNGKGFSDIAAEAARSGSIISEGSAKSVAALNKSLSQLKMWIGGIKNEIAGELLPGTQELVDSLRDFIKENKQLISGSIIGFFNALATAFKVAKYALVALTLAAGGGALIGIAAGITKVAAAIRFVMLAQNAFLVLPLVFARLIAMLKATRIAALLTSASIVLIPLLVGAAAAAILLFAEDLFTFLSGGESYIGELVEAFPALGSVIEGVSAVIYALVGTATELFNMLYSIVTLDLTGLLNAFDRLGDHVVDTFKKIGQSIYDALPAWLQDGLGAGVSGVVGAVSSIGGASSGGFLGASPMIAPAAASAAVSNSSSRTMQDNRQYNITGTDIGEVKRVLNEKNAFAAKTIDTGVEY